MTFDEETIVELKDSIEKFKLVYNPIRDKNTGEVLVGKHRMESLKRLGRKVSKDDVYDIDLDQEARAIGVEPEFYRLQLISSSNIQRQVPKKEKAELILEYVKYFKKIGIPDNQLASKVVEVAPFPKTLVYEVIPEEYKSPEKVRAGLVSAEVRREEKSVPDAEQNFSTPAGESSTISKPADSEGRKMYTGFEEESWRKMESGARPVRSSTPVVYDYPVKFKGQTFRVRITVDPAYFVPRIGLTLEIVSAA